MQTKRKPTLWLRVILMLTFISLGISACEGIADSIQPMVTVYFYRDNRWTGSIQIKRNDLGLSAGGVFPLQALYPSRSYCVQVLNQNYHDTEYSCPLDDHNLLFERLVLEINQAELSWITILRKADNFRKAYHRFDGLLEASKKAYGYGLKEVVITTRLRANEAL